MAKGKSSRSSASGPLDVFALVRDPLRAKELLADREKAASGRSTPGAASKEASFKGGSEAAHASLRDDASTTESPQGSFSELSTSARSIRVATSGRISATLDDVHNSVADWETEREISQKIAKLVQAGWPAEDAKAFELLASMRQPIAKALRSEDPRFSASTYKMCRVLSEAERRQKDSSAPVAPPLYRNFEGTSGLIEDDPAWINILKADLYGFRGLTSSSMVRAFCKKSSCKGATEEDPRSGFAVSVRGDGGKKELRTVVDSAVVCFESEPDDRRGRHTAVMVGKDRGAFPPNTLFSLKEVQDRFFYEPGGVWIEQPLYVVSATWSDPSLSASGMEGADMSQLISSINVLHYGRRGDFARGLDTLFLPGLTMEMEFDRDLSWKDHKGERYTLREEWAYVTGRAQSTPNCTPGHRDQRNDGKTVEDFRKAANDFIARRRAARSQSKESVGGRSRWLEDEFAYLSVDDVLAIRLYTGPAYQPINAFLREVSKLTGSYRIELARHPGSSFACTVSNIIGAIRKLSDVAIAEDYEKPLYRGVRGELPARFWLFDDEETQEISATDYGFMSTSRDKMTSLMYMDAHGPNVLWEVFPAAPTPEGFHFGADVSMLSQFSHETEVLFPPGTMLTVKERTAHQTQIIASLKTIKALRRPSQEKNQSNKSLWKAAVAAAKDSETASASESAESQEGESGLSGRFDDVRCTAAKQAQAQPVPPRAKVHPQQHFSEEAAFIVDFVGRAESLHAQIRQLRLHGRAAQLTPEGRHRPSLKAAGFASMALASKGDETGRRSLIRNTLVGQKTQELRAVDMLGIGTRSRLVEEMRAKLDVSEEREVVEVPVKNATQGGPACMSKAVAYVRLGVAPTFV